MKLNLSKFGHRASGIGDKSALLAALTTAATLLSLAPLEQSQAQLFVNVYPSQDNPTTQTLWIFSGSSTNAAGSNSIRTSTSSDYYQGDTWQFVTPSSGNIFDANKPSDTNFQPSSLFAKSNTNDIESIQKRIPGGDRTQAFAANATNATNTPTITIGSGSRTISHLFFDDDSIADDMGIRVSGSALSYSSGASSAWRGSGLVNKPIGDFFTGTFNHGGGVTPLHPNFAANSAGAIQITIHSAIIPEPEQYALVFGLFALGFVFFHRHRQKKQRQQAQTITS